MALLPKRNATIQLQPAPPDEALRHATRELAAGFIASGLDPERSMAREVG